jgi:hypothetical protein
MTASPSKLRLRAFFDPELAPRLMLRFLIE